MKAIGEAVTYVDPVGKLRPAIVTAVWSEICINVAFVNDDEKQTDVLTLPGTPMGTWDYLAPEQAINSHDVDVEETWSWIVYTMSGSTSPFVKLASDISPMW